MPVGWFDLADAWNRKFRAYPALGLAVYGDYLVNGYLSIGVSPEVVWNIVPSRADDLVGTMYAANLRIGARYPGFRLVEPYGVLAGGYSIITLADSNNSAKGFLISAVAGLRLKLWPRHSLFGEAGYQKGFQRLAGGAYAPSFLITGAGWQMVFR
jgi:hypothetical protein